MRGQHRSNELNGWASTEFGKANFGDKRLTKRLVKLADNLAELPESPINQACASWPKAKAAYQFFKNDDVVKGNILAAHVAETVKRAKEYKVTLAIQDTCYICITIKKQRGLVGKFRRPTLLIYMRIYEVGLIINLKCL